MRICSGHWAQLRVGVEQRRMGHLVAKDAKQAFENTVLELEGRSQEAYPDVLMAANNMIWSRALELVGLSLMMGDLCPVCEGIKANAGVIDPKLGRVYTPEEEEAYWIDGPLDQLLKEAVAAGFMPASKEQDHDLDAAQREVNGE